MHVLPLPSCCDTRGNTQLRAPKQTNNKSAKQYGSFFCFAFSCLMVGVTGATVKWAKHTKQMVLQKSGDARYMCYFSPFGVPILFVFTFWVVSFSRFVLFLPVCA